MGCATSRGQARRRQLRHQMVVHLGAARSQAVAGCNTSSQAASANFAGKPPSMGRPVHQVPDRCHLMTGTKSVYLSPLSCHCLARSLRSAKTRDHQRKHADGASWGVMLFAAQCLAGIRTNCLRESVPALLKRYACVRCSPEAKESRARDYDWPATCWKGPPNRRDSPLHGEVS